MFADIEMFVKCLVIAGSFLVFLYVLGVDKTNRHRRKLGLPPMSYIPAAVPSIERKPYTQVPTAVPTTPWMFPAGVLAIIMGLLAFVASAAMGSAHSKLGATQESLFAGALFDGLLNPLFFIGFPLGLYWCIRGKQASAGNAMRSQQDRPAAPPHVEDNPRLTHCSDCGGHVSRLAPSCPHCGRPLTPEKTN